MNIITFVIAYIVGLIVGLKVSHSIINWLKRSTHNRVTPGSSPGRPTISKINKKGNN